MRKAAFRYSGRGPGPGKNKLRRNHAFVKQEDSRSARASQKNKKARQHRLAPAGQPDEAKSIGADIRERFFLFRLSLYKMFVLLTLGIGVAWALVRVGTFFLLPSLDNHLQQTVNVSPWWVVLGMQGLCLGVVVVVFAFHFVVEKHGALIWIAPGAVIAVSIVFESFVQLAIPGVSLAYWVFHANTTSSIRSYERQVSATPYIVQYRRMRVRNAQIENWQCSATPIKTRMSFLPEFAGRPLCLTVHEGSLGWEWIENLRVCSETDLQQALPLSPCEVWAPGMDKAGFPKKTQPNA